MTTSVALSKAIRALTGGVCASTDPTWSRPVAIRVIDCVLSLNRHYDRFVAPRLEALMRVRPDLQTVAQLRALLQGYPSADAFVQNELNYRHPERAQTLAEVVGFVSQVVGSTPPEAEAAVLQAWARSVNPGDYKSLMIKGFGLGGFQYLRMLFGAQTTKPGKHIIDFVSEAIGRRRVSEIQALTLLESAAKREGVSLRNVDTSIWEARARGESRLMLDGGASR